MRKIEAEIEQLNRLRDAAPAEAAAALRKALGDRVNLMVAKAAALAAELKLEDLVPDLLRAYDRLFKDPRKSDPQCWGKTAIAKALVALDHRESPPFLRGAQHVQMEPVWGGEADSAFNLRGVCVLALPACTDLARENALRHLVTALADPIHNVRFEAVRAIAQMDGAEGELLLRLKALLGDEQPEITGQVFDSLIAVEGETALRFLAEFFKREGTLRTEAALAIGSSRLPGAFDLLRAAWDGAREIEFRQALARGLSASRDERAIEFLLALAKEGRSGDRDLALEALRIHRETPEIWKRVEPLLG